MNNIIKFLWAICLTFSLNIFAQNQTFSEGKLVVNQSENIPVKIFANPYFGEMVQFLEQNDEVLVVLSPNHSQLQGISLENAPSFYEKIERGDYVILDENFKNITDFSNAKYIVKSSKIKDFENQNIILKTDFKIWNPNEGIEIFGFKLRYYGLMFVIAFGLGLMIMRWMFRTDKIDEKYLDPLFMLTILGTIFGARIGHIVFYEPERFVEDFWSVFLPIRTKPTLEFTGFSGLASHGAAFALIGTTLYYSFKIIKKNPLWTLDRMGIVVALAGFFIRMGNFFNSEIIGKPIDPSSPLAILFPQQSLDYGAIVPRYPMQLIEAVGYLCLFFVLLSLYKFTNKKYQEGWLFGFFFFVLWSIRFFAEFLKEPQGEEYISFFGLNTGQVLSLPFIIIGFLVMMYSQRKNNA